MIKAEELRIGNWISGIAGYEKVETISQDPLLQSNWITKYYINRSNEKDYNPIPLSEDILLKCGFEFENGEEKTDDLYWYMRGNVFCLFQSYDYSIDDGSFSNSFTYPLLMRYGNPREYKSGLIVEYIHQLQNLYFSLTGQELNVNLDKQ